MKSLLLATAALAVALHALPSEAAVAKVNRSWQFKDTATALEVDNLIGDVRIERAATGGFEVAVEVTTTAATEAEARALADAVEFRAPDAGAASKFQVVLPVEKFPRIYRDDAPSGWFGGRMYAEYLGEKRRLSGDPDDSVQVRVDLVIKAPADSRLDVENVFGNAIAAGYIGFLSLDGSSGSLQSIAGSGRVDLDTGSGPVTVEGHNGDIRIDTGSGSVRVRSSEGSLEADTGSGSVDVEGFTGSVHADTGSGSVTVGGLAGASELMVETGSGGVRVGGDLSTLRRLDIDTGSGGVRIEATAWPSMTINIDTGSGSVDVDIPGVEDTSDDKRRRMLRIGDGSGRGVIDTGSGSVSLRTTARPD